MKPGRLALVVVVVACLLWVSGAASASTGCRVSLTVQPPVVNLPSGSLSGGGPTFGEVVDVNYSSALNGENVSVQYLNGSTWKDVTWFTGNSVGLTEVGIGVDSGHARLGDNFLRASSSGCTSEPAHFVVRSDGTAVAVDALSYLGLASGAAAFAFGSRLVGWKKSLILAGGVYIALSPFTGQRYDVYFLLSSGIRVLQHVNPFDPGNPPLYPGALKWAYPPIYAVYSAFAFLVYQLATGAPLPGVASLTYPGWLTSTYSVFQAYVPSSLPVLVFILKIPMIAAALATGVLLWKMTGRPRAVAGWLTNPLVILVGAIWGQLDPIATALALGAVYEFKRGKPYHAYLAASFGAAVKVWPILLIPLMLVVTLRRQGVSALKPLVAVIPALAVTLVLYGAFGNPANSLFVLLYARGIPTFAGAFTVNGLTWQQILLVLNAPPVPLFFLVGIPLYLAILVQMYRKRDEDVVKWLVVSILILYLTYNYVNPQYFYWILPFLMLQGRRLASAVFTALPMIYIALSYNIFYFISPALLPDQFSLGASIVEQMKTAAFYQSSVLLVSAASVVPTAAYLALLYVLLRRDRGGRILNSP